MRKRDGYCLSLDGDDSLILKVSVTKDKQYKLDWINNLSASEIGQQPLAMEIPGHNLVQVLPDNEVSLMTVMLPEMKNRMMSNALKGLIVNEKGGERKDWIIDFKTARKGARPGTLEPKSRVTSAVANKAFIDEFYGEAEELGFSPGAMMPGYLALEQLLRLNEPDLVQEGGWILVFLGKNDRFLCAGDDESLLFARILPEDLSGGTEENEYIDKIAVEIERSVFFAQQMEHGIEISRIIVSGDPVAVENLAGKLSDNQGREIIRWNPENLFLSREKDDLWEHTLKIAAAVSALHGPSYNLLPPDARVGKDKYLRRYATVAFSVLAGTVALAMLIGGVWTAGIQKECLADAAGCLDYLDERVESAAESYLHNRAMKACRANIEELGKSESWLAEVMREIALRTPENIVFESMKINIDSQKRHQMILKGRSLAPNGELAQQSFLWFLEALDSYPWLREKREPSFLEIAGVEENEIVQSRVAFTLEYFILEGEE